MLCNSWWKWDIDYMASCCCIDVKPAINRPRWLAYWVMLFIGCVFDSSWHFCAGILQNSSVLVLQMALACDDVYIVVPRCKSCFAFYACLDIGGPLWITKSQLNTVNRKVLLCKKQSKTKHCDIYLKQMD